MRAAWVALIVIASGCSGSATSQRDAGVIDAGAEGGDDASVDDAAADDGELDASVDALRLPEMPAPPIAPALPNLLPCPTGWREVTTTAGAVICDPFPATGEPVCSGNTAFFPGESGCTRIGSACPASGWAPNLPAATRTLYVRANGGNGGMGTQSNPYGQIDNAIAAATPGTLIALDVGTFADSLILPDGVTLWGACADTHIAGAINLTGGTTRIGNLTVRGKLVVQAGTHTLSDVIVTEGVGLLEVNGGSVTGTSVVLHGTTAASTTSDLVYATGPQTRISLTRARLESSNGSTAHAVDGAQIALTDVVVADNRYGLSGGINGARISAERLAMVRTGINGGPLTISDAMMVAPSGGRVGLTGTSNVVSRATMVGGLLTGNTGSFDDLVVQGGAVYLSGPRHQQRYRRVQIEAAGQVAILMVTAIADVDLQIDDLTVRGAAAMATVSCHNVAIGLHRARGVDVGGGVDLMPVGAFTSAEISDLDIGIVSGGSGRGVYANSASIDLRRAHITNARGIAIQIRSDQNATFEDLVIDGVTELPCVAGGTCPEYAGWSVGLGVYSGNAVVTRFRERGSRLAGVQFEGGTLDLHEGILEDNAVGVNMQVVGYDTRRLLDHVVMRQNGINLDSSSLPLPPLPIAP